MARKKEKQIRLGKNEGRLVNKLLKKIRDYRIFDTMMNERETNFNDRLMDYLRQNPKPLAVNNTKITPSRFVGELFRPEFYLVHSKTNLCSVECKRLTDSTAKARWKKGLSQSLLYSETYKAVILVLLDFTKNRKYSKAFGKGNSAESRFAKKMRELKNIYIVSLSVISSKDKKNK